MARVSATSIKIASRLADEFMEACGEYAAFSAKQTDQCATALDRDFRGVWDEYARMTAIIRQEYKDMLSATRYSVEA